MMPFRVVLAKECLDGVRDRRAVISALIFPLLAPFLVYFLIYTMIEMRSQDKDLVVAVQGAEHAPHLVDWLTERGVEFSMPIGDPRLLVSTQAVALLLVVPEDFAARLDGTKTAYVELVSDSSRTDARQGQAPGAQLQRRVGSIATDCQRCVTGGDERC